MDRKKFITQCGLTCLGSITSISLLQGCGAVRFISGDIVGDNLVVELSDFEKKPAGEKQFKKYIVVENDLLKYPVCVYRFSENEYTALLMRCTHQGTELQVFGDKLQCPAHGSEFDNKGNIRNGPADVGLRVLPVNIENNQLKISLKK